MRKELIVQTEREESRIQESAGMGKEKEGRKNGG